MHLAGYVRSSFPVSMHVRSIATPINVNMRFPRNRKSLKWISGIKFAVNNDAKINEELKSVSSCLARDISRYIVWFTAARWGKSNLSEHTTSNSRRCGRTSQTFPGSRHFNWSTKALIFRTGTCVRWGSRDVLDVRLIGKTLPQCRHSVPLHFYRVGLSSNVF